MAMFRFGNDLLHVIVIWASGHSYVENRKITLNRINLIILETWDGYHRSHTVTLRETN